MIDKNLILNCEKKLKDKYMLKRTVYSQCCHELIESLTDVWYNIYGRTTCRYQVDQPNMDEKRVEQASDQCSALSLFRA